MINSLSIQSLLSVLFFVVSPSLGYFSNRKTNTLNIFGGELEHCSRPGTAAAGFISGPRCIHHPIDEDYHNICLDIEEVEGGDFCDVTVQENLCSDGGTILPCTEDSEANCPVKHFCVHEEAFADYLELAGGCDKIGHIKCEATNMMTILDYEYRISVDNDMKAAYALDCLKEKCKIL